MNIILHMSRAISTALVATKHLVYYGYEGLFESRTFDKEFFKEESEETELCYQILDKFALEASTTSDVYFVHIPLQYSLQDKLNGADFYYGSLLRRLKENFRVIDPTETSRHNIRGIKQRRIPKSTDTTTENLYTLPKEMNI